MVLLLDCLTPGAAPWVPELGRHDVCAILICVLAVWPGVRPGGPPKAEPGALTPGPAAPQAPLGPDGAWGVPISIVSKWAGHYDAAFTQRTYVHASDPDLEQGRRALARIHKIA